MIRILILFYIVYFGCLQAADRADFYDSYQSAENEFTDIGELPIDQTPWFGPVQLYNDSDEPLEISGRHSLDLNLEIVTVPDAIPPNSFGTVEVLYQPRNAGLLMPRLELTTSEGRRELLLRAQVTARDSWQILGYAWPSLEYSKSEVESFFTDAADLLKQVEENPNDTNRIIIDPRDLNRFTNAYVPGSVNMTFQDLIQRPHWKSKSIYIIDEGSAQTHVLTSLIRLRKAGFENLYWVQGGLRAWQAAGGDLVGQAAVSGQWAGLYPRDVANSLIREDFTVLNVGGESLASPLRGIFPNQTHIEWRGDYGSLAKDKPILVVADTNEAYLNVEPALSAEGFERVYYLHGGMGRLLKNLKAWSETSGMRFKLVRAGARNPRGKDIPETIVDRNCIDCIRRSRN